MTDANLVLGILDPGYFLGGAMVLDPARAHAAIERHVATPLGLSVSTAAARIRAAVEETAGREVAQARGRYLPAAAQPLMIAYGGAGAIHACAIARRSGLRRVAITPFSAVSSAFGSSLLDAGHLYYRRIDAPLDSDVAAERVAAAISGMRRDAERDMRGEGFAAEATRYELQVHVRHPGGDEVVIPLAAAPSESAGALACAADLARAKFGAAAGEELMLTSAGLLASAAVPHFSVTAKPRSDSDAATALKGTRSVYLEAGQAPRELTVYARERLAHGHELLGPVIVESDQTTLFVPADWRLQIDRFNNAMLHAL